MKKLLMILFAVALTVSAFGQADTSKYVLTIKQGKYKKVGTQIFLLVPTTLANNSNDTLKYLSMSCSWQEFYYVDNAKMSVDQVNCSGNDMIILTLAPHKSVDTEVRLVVGQITDTYKIKFKIGINLLKATKNVNNVWNEYKGQQETKNIIWSNAVTQVDMPDKEHK